MRYVYTRNMKLRHRPTLAGQARTLCGPRWVGYVDPASPLSRLWECRRCRELAGDAEAVEPEQERKFVSVPHVDLVEGDVIGGFGAALEVLAIGRTDCRRGFGHRHECPPGSRWVARVRGLTAWDRVNTSRMPWTTSVCLEVERGRPELWAQRLVA